MTSKRTASNTHSRTGTGGSHGSLRSWSSLVLPALFAVGCSTPSGAAFEAEAATPTVQLVQVIAQSDLRVLADLTIDQAEISWRSDDPENNGRAVVELRGLVELPPSEGFRSTDPVAVGNVHIGDRLIIDAELRFAVGDEEPGTWSTDGWSDGGVAMTIEWRSATLGLYHFRAAFDAVAFALSGAEEPAKLTFVLSLGGSRLTAEASIYQSQWDPVSETLWRIKAR